MERPAVSVVIPVYNVEKYIHKCVESVRNQTLRNIEIILVDDGSPDNCPQICDEYAGKDSRIKVVHKKNAGLGMACNTGLENATGEYVAFCDSDDWLDSNMYRRMYEVAIENSSDVVYTGLKRVDEKGKDLGYLCHPDKLEIYECEQTLILALDMIASEPSAAVDHRIQVSAKTVLYRRELLEKNKIRFVSEREFPSEDLIFNVSVLMVAEKVTVIPEYYYNYLVNDSSITASIKPHHFEKMTCSSELLRDKFNKSSKFSYDSRQEKELWQRISRFLIGESRSYSKQIIRSEGKIKEKKALLKELSSNSVLKQIEETYPLKLMPKKQRIILKLLMANQYQVLNFIYSTYEILKFKSFESSKI